MSDKKIGEMEAGIRELNLLWKDNKPVFKIGEYVKLRYRDGVDGRKKKQFDGKVIFKNSRYFTLKGRNYRESFMFVALMCGDVEIIRK